MPTMPSMARFKVLFNDFTIKPPDEPPKNMLGPDFFRARNKTDITIAKIKIYSIAFCPDLPSNFRRNKQAL